MGLDFVYLFMELEETFGVVPESSDFDGNQIQTVGDMIDLVERKIRQRETGEIMSEQYPKTVARDIKKTLDAHFNDLPFDDVPPDTLLGDIFFTKKRWKQFIAQKTSEVAEIESAVNTLIDEGKTAIISLLCYLIFIVTTTVGISLLVDVSFWGVLFTIVIPTSYFWIKATKRLMSGQYVKMLKKITFCDLVKKVVEIRQRHLKEDGSTYSHEEIEQQVITMISNATGIKVEKITREKTLVRDLGMN